MRRKPGRPASAKKRLRRKARRQHDLEWKVTPEGMRLMRRKRDPEFASLQDAIRREGVGGFSQRRGHGWRHTFEIPGGTLLVAFVPD